MKKFLCMVVDRNSFTMEVSVFETDSIDPDLELEEEIDRLTDILDGNGGSNTPYWGTCNITETPDELHARIARDFQTFCRDELSMRMEVVA